MAALKLVPPNATGSAATTNANHQHHTFLPDPPSNFSIDNSLSTELLRLSFEDRVAMEEEIHGVRCSAPTETPELLECSLREFDALLMARKLNHGSGGNPFGIDGSGKNGTNGIHAADGNGTTPVYIRRNLLRNVRSITCSSDCGNEQSWYSQLPHSENQTPTLHQQQTNSNSPTTTYCYLNDPEVRLRFLRVDLFVASKAVERLIHFIELTCELIGEVVAHRPIGLQDFTNRREEVALQNSRSQYLPFRDRAGRRVFMGVGSCGMHLDPVLLHKIFAFMHWTVSGDVETQQKGVVVVVWPTEEGFAINENTNKNEPPDSEGWWERSIRPKLDKKMRKMFQKMVKGFPLRITSRLGCYKDTPFFRALSALYYIGFDSQNRRMYKAHFGEDTELRYALASYGIPEHLLPLSNSGTVKTANHSRWINALKAKQNREQRLEKKKQEQQLQKQQQNITMNQHGTNNIHNYFYYAEQQMQPMMASLSSSENSYNNNTTNGFTIGNTNDNNAESELDEEEIVDCPGSRDVIFRKGPTYKNNPGNMVFRSLIEATHEEHSKATRKEKCRITWEIVSKIEEQGGRFLDWSKSKEMWVVAKDREKIRTKVAACYKQFHRSILAFQEQRLKLSQRQQKQQAKHHKNATNLTSEPQSPPQSSLPLPQQVQHNYVDGCDHPGGPEFAQERNGDALQQAVAITGMSPKPHVLHLYGSHSAKDGGYSASIFSKKRRKTSTGCFSFCSGGSSGSDYSSDCSSSYTT